jgi:hypothetical protein
LLRLPLALLLLLLLGLCWHWIRLLLPLLLLAAWLWADVAALPLVTWSCILPLFLVNNGTLLAPRSLMGSRPVNLLPPVLLLLLLPWGPPVLLLPSNCRLLPGGCGTPAVRPLARGLAPGLLLLLLWGHLHLLQRLPGVAQA